MAVREFDSDDLSLLHMALIGLTHVAVFTWWLDRARMADVLVLAGGWSAFVFLQVSSLAMWSLILWPFLSSPIAWTSHGVWFARGVKAVRPRAQSQNWQRNPFCGFS